MRTILLWLISLPLFFLGDNLDGALSGLSGECTIGVFSGKATADGRPMLWKNRDVSRAVQKFCYYEPSRDTDYLYSFIANSYAPDTAKVFMGLNEVGFGIINSNSYNLGDSLRDGIDDGDLIRMALERCRTLGDFEYLLDATARKGRKDCWNIGAVDAEGNAALYECSNYTFVKYDANDTAQTPDGIIIRATFGLSGTDEDRIGMERYKRACELAHSKDNDYPLDVEFVFRILTRDLANPIANPYPLPYNGRQNRRPPGFIYAQDVTINRENSQSIMVVRGTRPGEDPRLATLFCSIGQPVLTVCYPLWVLSGKIPEALYLGDETPMYTLVARHRTYLYPFIKDPGYLDSRYLVDSDSSGIYSHTLPLEREVIRRADDLIREWSVDMPRPDQIAEAQDELANYIFDSYSLIPFGKSDDAVPRAKDLPEIANYPNPFNASTTIQLIGFGRDERISVIVFDILGREVKAINVVSDDNRFAVWDGTDNHNSPAASGVYLIRAESSDRSAITKALLMK